MIVNYVYIRYIYNSSAYQFFIHKSSIEDIHPNTILEWKNVISFEDVFPWKEARKNHSLKRTIEGSLSNYHQSKDDEDELIKSKRSKKTKIFGPDILTYLLKNKHWTYSETMSCPKTSY